MLQLTVQNGVKLLPDGLTLTLTLTHANYGSKIVFGKQLPILKWYKNDFVVPVHL